MTETNKVHFNISNQKLILIFQIDKLKLENAH